MNTKMKLKQLASESKYKVYQDVANIFYKKWYINRWIINKFYINDLKRFLFYPTKVIEDITK